MTASVDGLPSLEDAKRITGYLDVQAPPPGPSAHFIFGTRHPTPSELTAQRYHEGLVPLVIVTGGVNRVTGVMEADLHRRILLEHGVPEAVIRCESKSMTTGENVELALPFLHKALDTGLSLTAVCKWYHRRGLQHLRHMLPEAPSFYAVAWDPTVSGVKVTRSGWFKSAVAARPVLREWQVIPQRLAEGTLIEVELIDGAWR
jgi:uncharacterized SAM-binding protein YcdF (DUF218 family)